jgi:hypothetical protein
MGTQVADLVARFGLDSTKLDAGLKGSKGHLQEFKGGLNDIVQKLTGFNVASLVGAAGISMLAKGVVDAIKETQTYNQSMLQLSRVTGAGVEETSRMVQWTDDLGLELGTLETAARGAAMKGIVLTTDSLAKMSDEYLKLSPGVERNTFLLKNFGRSGLEMARVMEVGSTKIKDMSGAIEGNLIVTEKAAKQSEMLRRNIDDLSDALTGYKYAIGNYVIPIINDWIAANKKANDELAGQKSLLGGETWIVIDWTDKYRKAAEAQREALDSVNQGIDNQVRALKAQGLEAARAKEKFAPLLAVASDYNTNIADHKNDLRIYTEYLAEQAIKADKAAIASQKLKDAQNALADAQKTLWAAQQDWNDNIGGQMGDKLEKLTGDTRRYRDGLAMIDDAMGTHLLSAYNLNKSMDTLVQQYASGKINADKFRAEMVKLRDAFQPLDEKVMKTQDDVDKLDSTLNLLNDKTVFASIDVTYKVNGEIVSPYWTPSIVGGGGGGGGTPEKPADEPGYDWVLVNNKWIKKKKPGRVPSANGISFIVPPGYNETYPIGHDRSASSGEKVTVTPVGGKGGGGIPINIYVSGAGDPRAVAREVALEIQRRRLN